MPFSLMPLKLWRVLQSPQLLFYTLGYFMVLLVVGTFAQKTMGVFQATHLFFNSFFYWLGPLPIPVGASVLTCLFLNLLAHFITRSQWRKTQIGVTLAHLSVLVLLLGGALTLWFKTEGFMILRQNETAQYVYDYHDRELQIVHDGKILYHVSHDKLSQGQILHDPILPFDIYIDRICPNCLLSDDGNALQPQAQNLDDEINQLGLGFTVTTGGGSPHHFVTTEFNPVPRDMVLLGNETYQFILQRKKTLVPFSLLLEKFSQEYYPNTDIAKGYASTLSITENHRAWPVLIAMNSPFRYKGYTFYQASVMHLPNGETASVLNVVDNVGWLFPYVATALLLLGLGFHFWVRYDRS